MTAVQTRVIARPKPSITPAPTGILQPAAMAAEHDDERDRELTLQRKPMAYSFGEMRVYENAPTSVQPKLTISRPGDRYEREADRVADMVMRMPASAAEAAETTPVAGREEEVRRQPVEEDKKLEEDELRLQPIEEKEEEEDELFRQPLEEEDEELLGQPIEEEEEELLRTKASPGAAPEVTPHVASRIQALRGGGQPLSASARAFFEPRFGHDFSHVRVHTDARSAESARAVNAKAYTVGRDVVFGQGRYIPQGTGGQKLLAHELAHVIQQGRGGDVPKLDPGAVHEQDAEAAAKAAISGEGSITVSGATGVGIARAMDDRELISFSKKIMSYSAVRIGRLIMFELLTGRRDRRLLKLLRAELDRRRPKPVTTPKTVSAAIAMLEEAQGKDEESNQKGALELVSKVREWMQPITQVDNIYRHFGRLSFMDKAFLFPRKAYDNVSGLHTKLRLGSTIGGYWPFVINVVKIARQHLEVLAGERPLESTSIPSVHKALKRGAIITVGGAAAILAAPLLIKGAIAGGGLLAGTRTAAARATATTSTRAAATASTASAGGAAGSTVVSQIVTEAATLMTTGRTAQAAAWIATFSATPQGRQTLLHVHKVAAYLMSTPQVQSDPKLFRAFQMILNLSAQFARGGK